MIRRLAVILLGCCVVFTFANIANARAGNSANARATSDAAFARDALARINFHRAQYGLTLLRMEARLAVIARDHAQDMMRRNYVDTRSPTGATLESRLRDAQYPYRNVVQQVAVGDPTGKSLVDRWMTRRESRKLLLSRDWREAGIGHAKHRNNPSRCAAAGLNHFWVMTLAAPTQRANRRWRRKILERVNRFRAQYKLAPLALNKQLNRSAQSHSDDMARRDYFAHVSPEGETVGRRATRAGYRWRTVLENLAAGLDSPVARWRDGFAPPRTAKRCSTPMCARRASGITFCPAMAAPRECFITGR
ncbi:MAG: hypothetical protein ACJAU6_003035 [Alphaproteobacteria bacterium]|jgi:uncharacterized protein YkwD